MDLHESGIIGKPFKSTLSYIAGDRKRRGLERWVLKVVTNEKGEAVGEVLTIIC